MANVLKHVSQAERAAAQREVSGLAGFNLNDLADEGRMRLDECRRQIQQMLQQAEEQAAEIRAAAKQQGYEEGMAQAQLDSDRRITEEASVRARDGLQRLQQAVEQLHQTHQAWMESYADTLSRVAIAAAEKVVRHRLDHERELLVRWADEALRSTRVASRLTVAVHPETLAELGGAFDQLLAGPDLPEQTHIEPDESVDRNTVIVRQTGGEINAGLMAQLRRLEELLS